jgi:beta-galactosidase
MQPITFDDKRYYINGKPAFLYSGEFHYFRVPKKDWRRRMNLFREAGGNCIATYIPWLIHEPVEGRFEFGTEPGYLDLDGFFKTACSAGLYVIAKPGPYQYSELKYSGLPTWLYDHYLSLRAYNIAGKPLGTGVISYLHPLLMEKVRKWFDEVCPIIAQHTVKNGGSVAFVQLDNELVGIYEGFGSLDYNPETMGFGKKDGRYIKFLTQKYHDILSLNTAYGTDFYIFEEVKPVSSSSPKDTFSVRRVKDYFDFCLKVVAEYAECLTGMIREYGIDVPVVHNSPHPEMNGFFVETAEKLGKQFLLGSDHYYCLSQGWRQNNPTPQYAIHCFYSLEMLRLMGYPPTVYELPGGSMSDFPPITPDDALACYMSNLALGMKGSNFYIFTGGPNPPGAGITTDIYDYGAAISADGEIRPLYQVQKNFGDFLSTRSWLANANRIYDCRFALDFDYSRSRKYWKERGDYLFSNDEAWDFFKTGALTTAFCAGISPAICNLGADDWVNDILTPVVVVSSSGMATDKQERIVRFIKNGGNILIMPVLPSFDENLNPCTILSDFLGSPTLSIGDNLYCRINIAGVTNVLKNGDVFFTKQSPKGSMVIGEDELTGNSVAWQINNRQGNAIFIGFNWYHSMREHERMLLGALKRIGFRQRVVCSNPNIWTSLHCDGERCILFMMNLFTSPFEAAISYFYGKDYKEYNLGKFAFAPMSVNFIEFEERK